MAVVVDGRYLYHLLGTFCWVEFNFVPSIRLFSVLQIDHKLFESRNNIFYNYRKLYLEETICLPPFPHI